MPWQIQAPSLRKLRYMTRIQRVGRVSEGIVSTTPVCLPRGFSITRYQSILGMSLKVLTNNMKGLLSAPSWNPSLHHRAMISTGSFTDELLCQWYLCAENNWKMTHSVTWIIKYTFYTVPGVLMSSNTWSLQAKSSGA